MTSYNSNDNLLGLACCALNFTEENAGHLPDFLLKPSCRRLNSLLAQPVSQAGSSHRVYKISWIGDPRITIQNDKGKAKAYQVKQVTLK